MGVLRKSVLSLSLGAPGLRDTNNCARLRPLRWKILRIVHGCELAFVWLLHIYKAMIQRQRKLLFVLRQQQHFEKLFFPRLNNDLNHDTQLPYPALS